jgi:PTH1 family peptidyl-tRNA hydrolase
MRVILGIGNPGKEYEGTRHNIGFMILDELARRAGAAFSRQKKWDCDLADWQLPASLGGDRALLLKPKTYVNRSGQTAQAALAFHKLEPAKLLVVVDDLNLPLGTLRLRGEGSSGGHNGLKDIEARLGKAYPRLRIGIGAPGGDQIGHVLGRFAPDEREDVALAISRAADCCERWLGEGLAAAMGCNGPLHPPAPKPKPPPPPPAEEAPGG